MTKSKKALPLLLLIAACTSFGTTTSSPTANDDAGTTPTNDAAVNVPNPPFPRRDGGGTCREAFADDFDSGSLAAWTDTVHAGTAALSAQGFDLAFDATNPQALDNNYARWTSAFLGTSAKLTFSFKQIELNDYAEVGCFLDLLGDENGADLLAVGPSLASDFNFVSTLYLAGNQITAAGRRGTVPMPPRGTFVEASILIELDRAANRFLITGTMNGTTVQVDDLEANLNPRFIQVRCGLIHSAKVTGRQAGSVDNVVLTTCNP